MLQRRWLWIVFIILAAGATVLALRVFPRAFPLVSLDIKMDRAHAIRAARDLATTHHWGPAESVRDAASFGDDGIAHSFVDLEGGGKSAFAALLRDDLYSPYSWQIRLFKESETNQTVVRFKPDGQPFGFEETLREQAPGAALDTDAAKTIAEAAAVAAPWNLPFARFTLAEKSQVVRPSGRVDHTFIYEQPDHPLGEGRLRMRLVVSGDRLTALNHLVKIPEAFTRRFEQMRSANNAIAAAASFVMVLLYLVAGCGGGLAFLIRQRAVLWRQPLAWAGVLGGLQLLVALNGWPLIWLKYDTALSSGSFLVQQLLGLIAGALAIGFVFFLSFLAAEGLTRSAFPQHPQFWKLWSRESGPTREVLGRTLGGYLLAGVGILYVSVFYFVALRHLGWWTPSEALVNPNSLAHYWPWLTPFAQAAAAGFGEEMLFRAIPLAGAALLGTRFGGRRWWIAGAFILQVVVFAAAHANYPGQPAYSRLVELLLPSCIFGALYLRFGLLPAIVLHFTYDVALMSLPLFASSADGIWIDRTLVVLLSLVPLWIILWRRWRAGEWRVLSATSLNGEWQPAMVIEQPEALPARTSSAVISNRLLSIVILAGLCGVAAWLATSRFGRITSPLEISRSAAIKAAQAELEKRGVKLSSGYRADARIPDRPWAVDRFVWQTAGPAGYETLLGNYLPGAHWSVRFSTFEGDVAERVEEWAVLLHGDGRTLRVLHKLPEARAGATLTEDEARRRVHTAIRENWALDPATLEEISATSAKRPNRVDWSFVLKDPSVKSVLPGEARLQVTVSGDEVTDATRYVFVPEVWERADRALHSKFNVGRVLKGGVIGILILAGLGGAIVAWNRKNFSKRTAVVSAGIFATGALLAALNQWPVTRGGFSTAQPLMLQQTIALVAPLLGILISALGIGLLAGYVVRRVPPPIANPRHAAVLGISIAATMVGGLALTALPRLQVAPPWPPLGAVATYSPWFAALTGVVGSMLSQAIVLLLVFTFLDRMTAGWQRRRGFAALLVFFIAAILLIPWGDVSVASWLGTTAAAALIFLVAYVGVLRRDLTLIPLSCGVLNAFNALAAGLAHGYPSALPATVVEAFLFVALGGGLTCVLRRLAAVPPIVTNPTN